MILGCSRGAAAEFSFFLGIPVMFGASLLKIVKFFLDGNSFTGPQDLLLRFWDGGSLWRVRLLHTVSDERTSADMILSSSDITELSWA